ncbi:hypothetical protein [Yoonia sp. SS1-5]|uniref:Uncharacterized protein n=1 Tax=Yoonia rhodophyticola TaxID=3137370 RepID=A0AAN0M830_9RHOB
MRYLFLSVICGFSAQIAVAGTAPMPTMPEVSQSSDLEGGLILLALVGVVIATSKLGGLATRNANVLEISGDDADQTSGY